MKILTLNCGSSSVKFSLFETSRAAIARKQDRPLIRGLIERIGRSPSFLRYKIEDSEKGIRENVETPNHEAAIAVSVKTVEAVCQTKIDAIGHRIVHGGPDLGRSCLIDDHVLHAIEAAVDLAPLHNPHNIEGVLAMKKILPDIFNVAAFDTGFHRTIPTASAAYALPHDLIRKHSLHRFGFHGLSHRFVTYQVEQLLGVPREELKILSCHLGNGASLTAVDDGESVETSMGFTPCEGLIMGTRPGDVDAGVVLRIMAKEGMTVGEAETLLNRRSGLLGLSGVSNDFRELLAARASGNEAAALAIDAFVHRLKKYFGAYAAVLGKVDAVAFTGGVGENVPEVRERALEGMRAWKIRIDEGTNQETLGREGRISTEDSIPVFVIPADEELIIARDTARCIEDAKFLRDAASKK